MLQQLARLFGAVYLIVGVLGFVPIAPITTPPPPDADFLVLSQLYRYLAGVFPVNAIHDVVHLAIGIWGLVSSRSPEKARAFWRGAAVVLGIFAILGFIPTLSTVFGIVPLGGYDAWLHAASALLAIYLGWGVRVTQEA